MKEEFDYVKNTSIKIKTPSGYKKFDGVRKMEKECVRITTETTFIECSCDHPLYNDDRVILAEDLFVGTKIQLQDKIESVKHIEFIGLQTVYDLTNVAGGHLYFTNNMLSHNCSFEGSSFTLIDSKHLSKLVSYDYITLDKFPGLKIYDEPKENRIYIVGVDTAKYGDGDYLSIQVTDITEKPFKQVASFRQRDMTYLNLVKPLNEIARYYNDAFIFIENNSGDGQSTADLLYEQYEYENIYSEKAGIWGFRTTTKSRRIGLQNFKQLIEDDMLIIKDQETIDELLRFSLKNGKYQATDGYSDDAVMATVASIYFLQLRDWVDVEDLKKFFEDNNTVDDEEVMLFGFMDDGSGSIISF